MKKLISLLVVVALMAACLATTVFATEAAEITVSSAEATKGEEVTLEVSIKNNPGFAATKVTLEYDNEALELTAITTNGKLLDGATVNVEKGIVSFARTTNVSGDGVLLTATFKVVGEGCALEVKANVSHLTGEDRTSHEFTSVAGKIGGEHKFGEWTVVEAANCTNTGLEQRVCSVCGEVETRVIATNDEHKHNGTYAYDELGHWFVCELNAEHKVGYELHTYGEETEENGWKMKVCTVCGYEHKEDIPEFGDMSAIVFALCAVSATGLVTLTAKKKED